MDKFEMLHVKPAVKGLNHMELDSDTLATMEFGQIVPLWAMELVPRDKVSVSARYFSRLAPLVTPTYGNFSFRTVAAFVPFHMIAVDAEAWISGKTSWEGYTPRHRYFTIGTLDAFIRLVCVTSTGATVSNSVYNYVDSAGVTVFNVFTNVGKFYVKILNSLGYALPSGVNLQSGSSWSTQVASKPLSAYNLLAFFKLYNDYMSQSQRFNTSSMSNILNAIKYVKAYTGIWSNSTGEILPGGLSALFAEVRLQYDNDYFTTAWQSPNNPLNTLENINSTPVSGNTLASTFADSVQDDVVDNFIVTTSQRSRITQRAIDFLRSFDNWVRRNNYSGSRVVQQVYSRFGIKTSDFRDHYAHIIKTERAPIMVGDVTATADTAGSPLGDYAGKGIMDCGSEFHYESNDYGLLLVLGYFTVKPMYAYGFDRSVLRTAPLDFYTPEFDGLGADAISVGEVYADPLTAANGTPDDAVFGYTERYNAYRFGRDRILGDFRDYHVDGAMNAWHSGRNLSAIRSAGTLVAQTSAMNSLPQVDSEYNRIFSITSGSEDHFYLTCKFKVDANRPMKNMNEVVGLGVGDLNVPRNGNEIS